MKKREFIDQDVLPEFEQEYDIQMDIDTRIIINDTTNNQIKIMFNNNNVKMYFMNEGKKVYTDNILSGFKISQVLNINSLIPNMKSYLNASSGRKMLAEKTTRKL